MAAASAAHRRHKLPSGGELSSESKLMSILSETDTCKVQLMNSTRNPMQQ